jgi:hypothetical protein
MNKKYKIWINNYQKTIYRKCKEVSNEMRSIFPELRIAKGFIKIAENNKWYQHQWCVCPNDNIVDPTAKQYSIIEYKEIKENDLQPVGKCHHCGEYVFGSFVRQCFCCNDCYEQGIKYYKNLT